MATLLNTANHYLDRADSLCRSYVPQLPDHAVSEVVYTFFCNLAPGLVLGMGKPRAKSEILEMIRLQDLYKRGNTAEHLEEACCMLKSGAKGAVVVSSVFSLVAVTRMVIAVAYRHCKAALGFPTDRTRPNYTVAFEDIGSYAIALLFKAYLQKNYIPSLKTPFVLDLGILLFYSIGHLCNTASAIEGARTASIGAAPYVLPAAHSNTKDTI